MDAPCHPSEPAALLLGYESAELLGRKVGDLMVPVSVTLDELYFQAVKR